MNIFISYPRELKEKAEVIHSEISSKGNTVFIDKNINNPDEWRNKINESLRNTSVFIILYNLDENKADDPSRFITTEVKLIEKELNKHNTKKCIIILFPPATTKTLPVFFRKFNCINYRDNDILDYEWTSAVIESIEKLKQEEEDAKKEEDILKQKEKEAQKIVNKLKVILFASTMLIMTSLAIFWLLTTLFPTFFTTLHIEKQSVSEEYPEKLLQPSKMKPKLCSDAESVRDGALIMKNKYEYINTGDNGVIFRGTSVNGVLKNLECKEANDRYVLTGIEETIHDIEVSFDGKIFEHFGTSKNIVNSTISFNENGEESERTFFLKEVKETDCTHERCQDDQNLKDKLQKSYESLVKAKHDESKKNDESCSPLIVEKELNRNIYIISICKSYVRMMIGKY